MTTVIPGFSDSHVLRTESEYNAAIAQIELLLDAEIARDSEGLDRLKFLSVLVEHYEDREFPAGAVIPRQAVRLRLEHKGLHRMLAIPADVLPGLDT